jgi:hypothetical protein
MAEAWRVPLPLGDAVAPILADIRYRGSPPPVTLSFVGPMVLVLAVLLMPFAMAVGLLVWGGAALLLDLWHCRHPSLDASTLADEARRWLDHY